MMRERKMKIDASIPSSAATKNLKKCLWILVVGLLLVVLGLPSWVFTLVFSMSGAYLLSMVMCILDVQEFKMKQNQTIVELLSKLVNRDNNDNCKQPTKL